MNQTETDHKKSISSKKRSPSDLLSLKKTRDMISRADELLQDVRKGAGLTSEEIGKLAIDDLRDQGKINTLGNEHINRKLSLLTKAGNVEVVDFNQRKRKAKKC